MLRCKQSMLYCSTVSAASVQSPFRQQSVHTVRTQKRTVHRSAHCHLLLVQIMLSLLLLLITAFAATATALAMRHTTVAAAVGMRTEGGGILSSMAAIDVLLMAVYFAVLAAAHKSVDLQRMFRPSHKQEAPEMPNKVRCMRVFQKRYVWLRYDVACAMRSYACTKWRVYSNQTSA
jgi:hypothetical protein